MFLLIYASSWDTVIQGPSKPIWAFTGPLLGEPCALPPTRLGLLKAPPGPSASSPTPWHIRDGTPAECRLLLPVAAQQVFPVFLAFQQPHFTFLFSPELTLILMRGFGPCRPTSQ